MWRRRDDEIRFRPGDRSRPGPYSSRSCERAHKPSEASVDIIFAPAVAVPVRLGVSDDRVIPFRKRPPSETEMEIFRKITRNWHPDMQRLMFPEHVQRDRDRKDRK
jgi:hypothetical protein